MDGQSPSPGWSPSHPSSQGWSPTIQNTPKGIVLQTWNLASRINLQNLDQVKCHGWSVTIPRMVTYHPNDSHPPFKIYQKEVYYRLKIWHLGLTHKIKIGWSADGQPYLQDGHGHPPSKGWSPKIQIYQKEVYYRLLIFIFLYWYLGSKAHQ